MDLSPQSPHVFMTKTHLRAGGCHTSANGGVEMAVTSIVQQNIPQRRKCSIIYTASHSSHLKCG